MTQLENLTMDQNSFLKSLEQDEVNFYTEDKIPDCVDVNDLIVFNDIENSQCANFENDNVGASKGKARHTADNPSKHVSNLNCNSENKKPAKCWLQKSVTIKTMESEFKVLMWVHSDDDKKEDKTATTSKEIPKEIKQQHNILPTKLDYLCTFKNCSKAFKNVSCLRKHLFTHGPKTKICAECGKAFVDNSKLNRHMVVHTGAKPFKYLYTGCEKRFSLGFNLRTHLRIHTGFRPYLCSFNGCNKRFAQSSNLKSHQMIHTRKNNYSYRKKKL